MIGFDVPLFVLTV